MDLRERVERRLIQVDVSLHGPSEAVARLTADDFVVTAMGRPIDTFTVDRVCQGLERNGSDATSSNSSLEQSKEPLGERRLETSVVPTTYLFYFDHSLMTLESANEAPRIAKALIRELVDDGDRAMIASPNFEYRIRVLQPSQESVERGVTFTAVRAPRAPPAPAND